MSVSTNELDAMSLGNEEIDALRESVAEVLLNECDSRAVHDYIDGKSELDRAIWRQAAELGWLAVALPEADGGLGLGARGLQVLNRELGERTAPGPFMPTLCVAQWLSKVGSEAQRAEFLAPIVAGELTAAIPAALECVKPLRLAGDKVTGQVDVLGSVDAGIVVLPVGSGEQAEALAVVRLGGAGTALEPLEMWDRTRQVCRLECKDAPVAALIADPDGTLAARLGSYVAVAVAADSLGAADNIARKTVEYLKERVQFERPIASFQAIKHRAADLIAKITTQDNLLEQAVQSLDKDWPDADMWARLAKAGATEAFVFVAADCIQLHGGVGHTWEFDPHIYAKRARLNEFLLNNNRALRDNAVKSLAKAIGEGRTTTELDA
jgi:alkylation response protein AidB-like acyl-CoA dehydrogenase